MQYIEAISNEKPIHKDSLFIAGTITGSEDWQKYVVNGIMDLPITVFNPRRKTFDVSKKDESEKQIKWEYERLRMSKYVSFWFDKATVAPITLFELGAALERTDNLIIATDPKYPRIFDVKIQVELRKPGTKILNSLDKLIIEIRKTFSK